MGKWMVLGVSLVLRLGLLVYGDWQDRNMAVPFTDVDYFVFEDAARAVVTPKEGEGEGGEGGGGSVYDRTTYRYTPLLAWLLLPNVLLDSPRWGKALFAMSDLAVGWLLGRLLVARSVPEAKAWSYVAAGWLLNPLVFTVSTRGNAESFIALLVLSSLYCICSGRGSSSKGMFVMGSVLFGVSVHFKIYPILYALPIYFFLNEDFDNVKSKNVWTSLFRPARVQFALISTATFFLLGGLMYLVEGQRFLEETYLYHLSRKDHRHNFSVYFYFIYLTFEQTQSTLVALLAFLPQIAVCVALGAKYYRDIFFCAFVQTLAFVTFNKVCTSQYFLWYFAFLPLVLPSTGIRFRWKGLLLLVCWFGSQTAWLGQAFWLEFMGENTFPNIWLASVAMFLTNTWILLETVRHHRFQPTFSQGRWTSLVQQQPLKSD